MIKAGLNVARINFSHGDHDSNGKLIDMVYALRDELKNPVGVMADLQGPRIRVGNDEEMVIERGEIVFVSGKKSDNEGKELIIDSDGAIEFLSEGERILIEDGTKELRVVERQGDSIKAEVVAGGVIKPRKGINMPDTKLTLSLVSEKDEKDLAYAMSREVDFVALSFVGNGKEIESVREKMKKLLGREDNLPMIVSKIERKEALKNIDEIIEATDAVMVARGDLGVELPETKVVLYQKELIRKCLSSVKPVIVATQMLESMIKCPVPTRAEVSDVSNAVIDHTDAVMLSGESANGEYPIEAVTVMAKIVSDTEGSIFDDAEPVFPENKAYEEYATLMDSAYALSCNPGVKAILAISDSGFTARMLSHFRPQIDIIIATKNPKTHNQVALSWGVESYLFSENEDTEKLIDLSVERAKKEKRLVAGDKIVVILGRVPCGNKMRLVGIREI
jgi:pyruvate kinase